MIDLNRLLKAIQTGDNAPNVLADVLEEVVNNYHCPGAAGFEGVDTFPDCGEDDCLYCASKKALEEFL